MTTTAQSDRARLFSRYLWRVCYQLPMIGTLIAVALAVVLVLLISDYPFAVRLQTALGMAGLISIFGLIFTLFFPPLFRLFYLKVVRRHPQEAKIALGYGVLLGAGLPLLLAVMAAVIILIIRLVARLVWSFEGISGWEQLMGFIVFAGVTSAIPGAVVGPVAARFGLNWLRPHDPYFDVPSAAPAALNTGDAAL